MNRPGARRQTRLSVGGIDPVKEKCRGERCVPFRQVDSAGAPGNDGYASFIIRTAGANPLALAQTVRLERRRELPSCESIQSPCCGRNDKGGDNPPGIISPN